MKILALDTSTRMGAIALLKGENLIAEVCLDCDLTHSERLLTGIQTTLQMARIKIEEVDLLAVTIGPGSFTGLRIGLATAKGLATATSKPIIGVSSLEALSLHGRMSGKTVVPILDARREELYAAAFHFHSNGKRERLLNDSSIKPEELISLLKNYDETVVFGSGVETYRDFLEKHLSKKDLLFTQPCGARGYFVGQVAYEEIQRSGLPAVGADPLPNYLRPSDAQIR